MTLHKLHLSAAAPVVATLLLSACSMSPESNTRTDGNEAPVEWSAADAPSIFDESLEYRLADLPKQGEAQTAPWAGNYWPTYKDNINDKWAGEDSLSPSTKFGKAFGIEDMEEAVSRYHGIASNEGRAKACVSDDECNSDLGEACAKQSGQSSGYCIPTWWGICHAWAPAAVMYREPEKPVTLNGVTFEVQDIKALMTLMNEKIETRFLSRRCNANDGANEIEYDEYGRPKRSECMDTNPGTLHIILANLLGIRGESFVEDRTYDYQVWNQPVRGFEVLSMDEVSAREANALVGVENQDVYQFSANARRFFDVLTRVDYITESSAETAGNLSSDIDDYTKSDYYRYILELDADDRIIGGEWLDDSKRNHPDFLWTPLFTRPNAENVGGRMKLADVMRVYESSLVSVGEKRDLRETGSLQPNQERVFGPFNAAAGTNFEVALQANAAADIMLRRWNPPTDAAHDCRSYFATGDRARCQLSGGGKVYAVVRAGDEAVEYTLNTRYFSATAP